MANEPAPALGKGAASDADGSGDPAWLLGAARDVHSQCGEDGVIDQALGVLPARDGWCVEFGAWDGLHLSNTRHLVESRGYSAVLIEADPEKARRLRDNYASNPKVTALNRLVGFTPSDSLDQILAQTAIPRDFDFLSIDIDGNDYHAWKATSAYRPKLVCIEFNPTIPTEVSFVQPADPAVSQGSSLRALVELAREKGYELVAVTMSNAFFVRDELFALYRIGDNRPEVLRKDLGRITYIFSGYDGRVFLAGNRTLPWHGLPILERSVQQLPGFLQIYPTGYSSWQERLFKLWRSLRKRL